MADIEKLNSDYETILKGITEIQKELNQVSTGIYGDPKNRAIGLMERQAEIEKQMLDLWKEISEIKKVNENQELQLRARNDLKNNWWIIIKNILIVIGTIVTVTSTLLGVYYFVKGQLPADAIIK